MIMDIKYVSCPRCRTVIGIGIGIGTVNDAIATTTANDGNDGTTADIELRV